MDSTARAAFIVAQAAMLNAEIAGMIADNEWRQDSGLSIAYGQEQFSQMINNFPELQRDNLLKFLNRFKPCDCVQSTNPGKIIWMDGEVSHCPMCVGTLKVLND